MGSEVVVKHRCTEKTMILSHFASRIAAEIPAPSTYSSQSRARGWDGKMGQKGVFAVCRSFAIASLAKIKLLALVVCLIIVLGAWKRTALEDCKQTKKNGKAEYEECKKTAPYKDQASFEKELSPYGRTLFTRLSPDKKERAMDYADDTTLSPDDAVAKVSCECKKVKS